jgi:hypothetical protein
MQTRIKKLFDSIFFTLTAALILLIYLQFFHFPNEGTNTSETSMDYIAIGIGIIAFMGMLPALSVIAVQHASEKWSSTIAKFYKEDRVLKRILRIIGTIGLIFLFLNFFPTPTSLKTPLLFCACGIVLDYVVRYYHKVCDLLDPNTACEALTLKAEKIINDFQCQAQRYANKNIEKEKEFYHGGRSEVLEKKLRFFTNDLSTVGYKAAINHESNTAEAALDALVKIAQCYARNREYNFTPEPCLRNCDLIVNSICEGIHNIFNAALRTQDKNLIRTIFETYQEIISKFLLISFKTTLENYNNKNELGEQQKEIFIIGLDGLYRCKEAVLGKFETDEINSTFVPLFYLAFLDETQTATTTLSNLQKFCFYITIIRKFYNYCYNPSLEYPLNYYVMITSYLGSIPSIEINKETISESDKKAISVILDADDWLNLIKQANNFFNRPDGRSCIWPIKTIKQNLEQIKAILKDSEEEKKIDTIIDQLDEILSKTA